MPAFAPKPAKDRKKTHPAIPGGDRKTGEVFKGQGEKTPVRGGPFCQKEERQQDQSGSDLGHQEVEETGFPHPLVLDVGDDEKKGRQGHAFPKHEKRQDIVRQQHPGHRPEKEGEPEEDPSDLPDAVSPEKTDGGEKDRNRYEPEHGEKKTGQGIEGDAKGQSRPPERQFPGETDRMDQAFDAGHGGEDSRQEENSEKTCERSFQKTCQKRTGPSEDNPANEGQFRQRERC